MRTDQNAWHTDGADYFHFCLTCETGRAAMQSRFRRWGTGGKTPCRDCQALREAEACVDLNSFHAAMDEPFSPEEEGA